MSRLRVGEWLAAAGGLALIVALFLPNWYYPTTGVDPEQALDGLTGFESFSVLDLYLVVVAAAGPALAVIQATRRAPALPIGAGVLAVVLGLVGVLLLGYRIANQPGPNEFMDVGATAWIGLAGAAAVLAGAWLSISDERVPGQGPPEDVEVRPAPRIAPDAQP